MEKGEYDCVGYMYHFLDFLSKSYHNCACFLEKTEGKKPESNNATKFKEKSYQQKKEKQESTVLTIEI